MFPCNNKGFIYSDHQFLRSWSESPPLLLTKQVSDPYVLNIDQLQVDRYVSTRSSLKRVCLLVDTKWGYEAKRPGTC